jgi:hypothetical protein
MKINFKTNVQDFHEHNFVVGGIGADESRVRNRVSYLLHTVGRCLVAHSDQSVRDELVHRAQSHAGDRSTRLLRLDHFKERSEKCGRVDLGQIFIEKLY